MILNLGSERSTFPGATNVDISPCGDIQCDLSKFPWQWQDNSIDGIYAFHIVEHFPEWKPFIDECIRILKPGGFLHIKVPHVTCVPSAGLLTHYRGMSYNGFGHILTYPTEVYPEPKLKQHLNRINWKGVLCDMTKRHSAPRWLRLTLRPIAKVIDFLIALSPEVFENVWCYWVGGAEEIEWKGEKL